MTSTERRLTAAVIAAHPDDEVLGCGGTIAAHRAAGDVVHVMILAEGFTSRALRRDSEEAQASLERLRQQAIEAGRLLGVSDVRFAGFPDNQMDTLPLLDIVRRVEAFIKELRPERIYTHHGADLNVDHRLTHQAVVTACRPQSGNPVQALYAFEIASSTEWQPQPSAPFVPTDYFDISQTLDAKLAAMSVYEGEVRPWPHPRSLQAIEHQARWRGAQAGMAAAEAMMCLRRLHALGHAVPD